MTEKTETLQTLRALLTESAASDWVIRAENVRSREFFFVRDALDMNREADTMLYHVHVYVDFEKDGQLLRGDAEVEISDADTPEECAEKIAFALQQAAFVQNQHYPLPVNDPADLAAYQAPEAVPVHAQLTEHFPEVYDALFRQTHPTSRVNSVELFVVEAETRVLTSTGTDISYPHQKVQFELVTEADGREEPVEVFTIYTLGSLDVDRIAAITRAQLEETAGRAEAVPAASAPNQRVVLSGDAVEEFLDLFVAQASAQMIYLKQSRAEIGKKLVEGDAACPVTITLEPNLAGCAESRPVDGEGKLLAPATLYKEGRVEALRADAQFGHYLGAPITGSCRTYKVQPGSIPAAELRSQPHLEILKFSSFVSDALTGDFGGEFRLARQVAEDGSATYVTSGAISENQFTHIPTMQFSKEMRQGSHGLVPEAILFDGVAVTGA